MEGDTLRLSVFLSPFLHCPSNVKCSDSRGPCLRLFREFCDWPNTLKNMEFQVVFKDRVDIRKHLEFETRLDSAVIVSPQPSSARWMGYFPEKVAVEGISASFNHHRQRYAGTRVKSYPADEVVAYLQALYVEAARQEKDNKEFTGEWLRNALEKLEPAYSGPDRDHEEPISGFLASAKSSRDGAEVQFRRVTEFHDWRKPNGEYPTRVQDLSRPTPGFHQKIAALASYPVLLRQLGLVLDIEIPDASKKGIFRDCLLSVKTLYRGKYSVETESISLATRYIFDPQEGLFYTKDSDDPQERFADVGALLLLRGGKQQYDVVQGDIDGAAIKIVHLIDQLQRMDPERAARHNFNLPALQSSGIALVRRDSDQHMEDFLSRWWGRPNDDGALGLEDVTVGFRADVWDDVSNAWRSLCTR